MKTCNIRPINDRKPVNKNIAVKRVKLLRIIEWLTLLRYTDSERVICDSSKKVRHNFRIITNIMSMAGGRAQYHLDSMLIRTTLICVVVFVLHACSTSTSSVTSYSPVNAESSLNVAADYEDLQLVPNLPPPQNTNQGIDELIAVNDLLEIDVFQVDDLDRTVRVDPSGNISMSLIGRVVAAGRTIPDLESEIERLYGINYLQKPEVTVFMKESSGKRITIDGEVRKPGIYPTSSTSTLLEIIAVAGGFTPLADDKKLYVYREFGNKKLVANFNVKEIRAGKLRDPRIFGGDVIVSFTSDAKVAAQNLKEALGIAGRAAFIGAL